MKTKLFFLSVGIASIVLTSCRNSSTFYTNTLRSQSFVQPNSDSRYDFLWVLDNSGSMKPRRDFVSDNLNSFLNILNSKKAIDYQMAVVTTDFFTDSGALVKAPSGLQLVKSSSANPVADMAEIINSIQDSNTSFWEQGLENSYQAVFKNKSKFMRSGVPLIVVYLTDEDDYSCQGHCWGVEPENNPDWISFDASRYIDFFKTVKASEKSDVIVFPIVGVNQTNCQVSSVGQRYMALSEAIGNQGKTGSVCDLDLPASYNNIAQIIADRGNVFRLDTPASGQNIRVFVDGALLSGDPANYIFDAEQNSIVITGALPKPGSIIEVTFEQSQTN